MVSPRIFPMVVLCVLPMAPCGSPIVLCCFPMMPCGSPIVLCCFPMVLCHGAAIRRSPAQLCGLPYGAVPRRCHQALTSAALRASLWCSFRSGFFAAASAHSRQRSSASSVPQSQRCSSLFRTAVSGAAADMLLAKRTKTPILCSGRWEGSIGKRKSGLPANHRARFKNSNAS